MNAVANLVFALVFSPLLLGVINRTKAAFAGRNGPPLLQPYYDLVRLFRKDMVLSRSTTWIFRLAPGFIFVSTLLAVLWIPFGSDPGWAFPGDPIVVAYLLGFARFWLTLSAFDTGSAFEGMGSTRELLFSALAEPALFVILVVLARPGGIFSMGLIFGPGMQGPLPQAVASQALAGLCLFALMLVENSRVPFDDPNTHLELTMVHEVMVLDHSGPALGLVLWASAVKLALFAALASRALLPSVDGAAWIAWPVSAFGMVVMAICAGVVESVMARLRLPHIPQLLIALSLLSAFGLILAVR